MRNTFIALVVTVILGISMTSPVYAITAQQEFQTKCQMQFDRLARGIENSIYADDRVCDCMFKEAQEAARDEKLQELADFYTEYTEMTYFNEDKNGTEIALIGGLKNACINRFYTQEQQNAELKKSMDRARDSLDRTTKNIEKFKNIKNTTGTLSQ